MNSVADVKIENLKPRTKYTFRIMAKNEVGAGLSADFDATTADKCGQVEHCTIVLISFLELLIYLIIKIAAY